MSLQGSGYSILQHTIKNKPEINAHLKLSKLRYYKWKLLATYRIVEDQLAGTFLLTNYSEMSSSA